MAANIRCSIVTPTQTVLDQEVAYASIPAWDGQLGVMSGQSPLLTQLGYGAMRLSMPGGGESLYLIEGGFAQIHDNQLDVLTDRATPANELNAAEAQAELAEANARVATSGDDYAKVQRDQARALAKLALARSAGGAR